MSHSSLPELKSALGHLFHPSYHHRLLRALCGLGKWGKALGLQPQTAGCPEPPTPTPGCLLCSGSAAAGLGGDGADLQCCPLQGQPHLPRTHRITCSKTSETQAAGKDAGTLSLQAAILLVGAEGTGKSHFHSSTSLYCSQSNTETNYKHAPYCCISSEMFIF